MTYRSSRCALPTAARTPLPEGEGCLLYDCGPLLAGEGGPAMRDRVRGAQIGTIFVKSRTQLNLLGSVQFKIAENREQTTSALIDRRHIRHRRSQTAATAPPSRLSRKKIGPFVWIVTLSLFWVFCTSCSFRGAGGRSGAETGIGHEEGKWPHRSGILAKRSQLVVESKG